jgi:hypothetical protein
MNSFYISFTNNGEITDCNTTHFLFTNDRDGRGKEQGGLTGWTSSTIVTRQKKALKH